MIARVSTILGSSCNEYSSIISLNTAESNGYVEVNVQQLSCLLIILNIVECQYLLVKLKEMNLVCDAFF